MKSFLIELDTEQYEVIRKIASTSPYIDEFDCVYGILSMAITRLQNEIYRANARREREFIEDPGGGVHHVDEFDDDFDEDEFSSNGESNPFKDENPPPY